MAQAAQKLETNPTGGRAETDLPAAAAVGLLMELPKEKAETVATEVLVAVAVAAEEAHCRPVMTTTELVATEETAAHTAVVAEVAPVVMAILQRNPRVEVAELMEGRVEMDITKELTLLLRLLELCFCSMR